MASRPVPAGALPVVWWKASAVWRWTGLPRPRPHNRPPPRTTSVRCQAVASRPSGAVGAGLRPGQAQDLLQTPLVEGQRPFQLAAALCCVFGVLAASGAASGARDRLRPLRRRIVSRSRRRSCRSRLYPCGRPGALEAGASNPRGWRPRPTTAWPHRRRPVRALHHPPSPAVARVVGLFFFSFSTSGW